MRISFLLPYSNPHVTGWIDEFQMMNGVQLSVGIVKEVRKFRDNYFSSQDLHPSYCYFFKGNGHRKKYFAELKNADAFVSLGLFNLEFLFSLLFLRRNTKIFVLTETFNPIASKKSLYIRTLYVLILKLFLPQSRISFLAIGGIDVKRYYVELGFKDSVFFNFGYFPKCLAKERPIEKENEVVDFIFVGQLIPRKGIDILEKAVEYLKSNHFNWRFKIFGDGPLRESVLLLAASDSRISYMGVVDNPNFLEAQYESSNILFLPSYFDGWGAVVNEALSKGCSLLLSRNVYSSKYLLREGANGFSFDPYDLGSLYRSIDNYFLNQRILEEHARNSLLVFNEWNHVNAAKTFYRHLKGEGISSNQNLFKIL